MCNSSLIVCDYVRRLVLSIIVAVKVQPLCAEQKDFSVNRLPLIAVAIFSEY